MNLIKTSLNVVGEIEIISDQSIQEQKTENKNIEEHCDFNELVLCHRIHIPIITNDQVIFHIDKIPFFLEEGKVYEINNQKLHSVENNSNFDRVHLIIDILPFSKNINVCYEGF